MMDFQGAGTPLTQDGVDAALKFLNVGAAEMWTVLTQETGGFGYLPDRRPAILFERHLFHRATKGVFDAVNPAISSPSSGGYLGGAREYDRLAQAIALDRTAALSSASWGLGQVLGSNFAASGFDSVEQMVQAMVDGEDGQLQAMAGFMRSNNLHTALANHAWAKIAAVYNGPNFAENHYDTLLAAHFQKLSAGPLPDLRVRETQALLTYLGLDPAGVDGVVGKRTRSAVVQFREANGLGSSDQVDDALLTALRAAVTGAAAAGATAG